MKYRDIRERPHVSRTKRESSLILAPALGTHTLSHAELLSVALHTS